MNTKVAPKPRPSFRDTQLWKQFSAKVEEAPDGCWNWQSVFNNNGYGQIFALAHRFAYEMFVGPIPDGLTLDHLCSNTHCVNPAHLEAVSQAENQMRSPLTIAYKNSHKTHCVHGHPFSPENTYIHNHGPGRATSRECRTCAIRTAVKATRRYRAKKRLSQGEIVKKTCP